MSRGLADEVTVREKLVVGNRRLRKMRRTVVLCLRRIPKMTLGDVSLPDGSPLCWGCRYPRL